MLETLLAIDFTVVEERLDVVFGIVLSVSFGGLIFQSCRRSYAYIRRYPFRYSLTSSEIWSDLIGGVKGVP